MRKLQWTPRAYATARCHMCTYSASDRIDVGERKACMPQTHGLLDKFLWMACAA